jgi:hypothetical protein
LIFMAAVTALCGLSGHAVRGDGSADLTTPRAAKVVTRNLLLEINDDQPASSKGALTTIDFYTFLSPPVTLTPTRSSTGHQTRMVKGLGSDRHRSLPSLLPSKAQIFCWRGRWSDLRGVDVFDTMINQARG